ncbi:MAG: bifunctional proline dehydrogenase/L-glutamate gamma-semialdehyde dehydrogenase PutA [Albidovulum sp.]|nr:bifunctional proline dehydrogenase/L-glutamate gamma-semialdehyde dehydrogenase PutA [Albidovulum sp.]
MEDKLDKYREQILSAKATNEDLHLENLLSEFAVPEKVRLKACEDAESLVGEIRSSSRPGLVEAMLAEYGLGTSEGIALLRLAEALMRVEDNATADALIADKLVAADWSSHRGRSPSRLVNVFTLGLSMASACLKGSSERGFRAGLRKSAKGLFTPIIRVAARRSLKLLAGRFVLGRTIGEAVNLSKTAERNGFHYSYDMLGEAALNATDAQAFYDAYKTAIATLAAKCDKPDFRDNHGVSIKLSALHPRYELTQRDRVLSELVERVSVLSKMAKDANMGINIDAEEADRLELSLEVIKAVLQDPELRGWDGFGIVVQAYGKAAPHVIDYLYELAKELDRKIMIRLVKGAYWDTEIKRAQVEGLVDFPVFTRKAATDISYLCCAKKLLGMTDRIYPQFAGHNAHTVSAILGLADGGQPFEFQRIHGMGEALHSLIRKREDVRCRIYAPVGEHRELLPYLARRMLENGANSSFVNQIADLSRSESDIAACPFESLARARESNIRPVVPPSEIFGSERRNSKGWDLHNPGQVAEIEEARAPHRNSVWSMPTGSVPEATENMSAEIVNPADTSEIVGSVREVAAEDADRFLENARDWSDETARERSRVLIRASEIYEERADVFFALLCREAGKTLADATAELREAVDFLRYYALEGLKISDRPPLGVVVCISPWNFPFAIFTGQVAGALAAGNGVLAKPARQTPLIANLAVECLHEAGVPDDVLKLLPGSGATLGARLVSSPKISGVCFTGSTETARMIEQAMSESASPDAPLIAETGGLNAMIVDSTALPEQAIKAIIVSAFQSAGQRCSALRMLYLQEDIANSFLNMLFGAMDELRIHDPWDVSTDVGPLIDSFAKEHVNMHIEAAHSQGRLLKQCSAPDGGNFIGPAVISVKGIADLEEEIFGPVLHVATFRPNEFEQVVDAINASGYGLTFGMHSRIDERVERLSNRLKVGNIYVNRNQIGAVVGSQPFGGEGLSGTGPKAGGPEFLRGLTRGEMRLHQVDESAEADPAEVQGTLNRVRFRADRAVKAEAMPGPTGETNDLRFFPRGTVLCLGPRPEDAVAQASVASDAGCSVVVVAAGAEHENAVQGMLPRSALAELKHLDVVALWSDYDDLRKARRALAARSGPIIPLVSSLDLMEKCLLERHTCIDTTAAGGNATLFAAAG